MADPPRWGAHPSGDGLWTFALWAPDAPALRLHLDGARHEMDRGPDGWHRTRVAAEPDQTYAFERDGALFPDPAARRQAGGVHDRSVLVDMAALRPEPWAGRAWSDAALMEVHVGTFTREGTLRAAAERLPDLARLGVTGLSLMPLGQFAGRRGWGYDGVLPFALHPAYGRPEDLAVFIDACHAEGLMVLIDVVYNHFGPEGNALTALCPDFFDPARHTPWGAAIAHERPPVAEFFLQNAEMWLRDYAADGLRLDAVHQIGDEGDTAFVEALARHVGGLGLDRELHIVAEDERNLVSYVDAGGVLRAQWNDDWHHAVHVLLTGESQSYYAPFAVDPFGALVTALRDGQVAQGRPRPPEGRRGEPSGHLSPLRFVNANQTHDQIGNRALGERLIALAEPGSVRVAQAMLLLAPFVPMLFMGEEEGARAPFRFFTDFEGELAEAVRRGRRAEFPEFAGQAEEIPDPNAPETFAASRPYARPAADAPAWRALTGRLLALRRDEVAPLLRGGWRESAAERLSERTLRAAWSFADGRLEMAASFEGPAPALDEDAREIFALDEGGAGLRVGVARR
ncbi:MAG: malto-oligosyltrehalose trehalohydrolase [Paracoccaceae bacterium]